ncbi:IniB N-terminal domain-containing protein [Micromonospora sp. SL1-18]|uniref:IniB N-terminal domain-containing protein n=1 Tax=Micromonospora sp. SL1-18 TaxID=3399128 RepID=UPI003A4E1F85
MDSQQSLYINSEQSVDASQTLHDFVLNLLTDPDARSAFDLDPEGALQAAGLTDVTAADVQDVVPLVVDYVPGAGLGAVAPVVSELGLDPLVGDATDVVGQLQAVPQQLSVNGSLSGVDVSAGALGAIAVDPAGLYAGAVVLPGIGLGVGSGGVVTDLTGVHDVANTLDSDVVGAVDTAVDPVVGDVTGVAGNPLGATDGLLSGDGALGGDLGALSGTEAQVNGLVGSLGVDHTVGGVTDTVGGLTGGVGGVTDTVGGVTDTVGGLTGGVTGGAHAVGGLTGTVSGLTGGVTGGAHADAAVHGDAHVAADGGLLGGLL